MQGFSLLVVEDDALLRETVCDLLREQGLNVHEAATVDTAIALLWDLRGEVQAVLSDIVLPGCGTGTYLMQVIERHWPRMPILLTSGLLKPTEALPPNVRFVQKPWRAADVIAELRDLIGRTAAEAGKPMLHDPPVPRLLLG